MTRPLMIVAMLMHVGFFAALSLMAPIHGADVAVLCTAMTVVVALSVATAPASTTPSTSR